MKFLCQLRVEQARHYLSQGTPIKEIAERLGFANVHHFTRLFRNATGLPRPPGTGRYTFRKAQVFLTNSAPSLTIAISVS